LRDFAELWPERFTSVTNGVTPRRFVALANPRLADLITEAIGDGWLRDLDRLQALEPFAEDAAFQDRWRAVKQANKDELAAWMRAKYGLPCDPAALLDAQCKRIHEYKRQHLNILHAVSLYLSYKADPARLAQAVPRTILFGGKAAPGYETAKNIIWLANSVGNVINNDPQVREKLRLIFVPNYNVSWAEVIIPATELSEQISTAGLEASGTGNMKFAMNGALTIGTLDGANVEMRDNIGEEHMFLFGLHADQVEATKRAGYDPRQIYFADRIVRGAIDALARGQFSPEDPGRFQSLMDNLLTRDPFLVLADFRSYAACQSVVEQAYRDPKGWAKKSILNVARMGFFSSDRTIRAYGQEIWGVAARR
ncbi:MAG TPA: glycogen/starch/alpha-glucan phosphorylase, partial [Polyangiaceae bacterium]|nr:glycogen/starch/alpha-glucan phosphorylase [Polyangiaceae bacterium]